MYHNEILISSIVHFKGLYIDRTFKKKELCIHWQEFTQAFTWIGFYIDRTLQRYDFTQIGLYVDKTFHRQVFTQIEQKFTQIGLYMDGLYIDCTLHRLYFTQIGLCEFSIICIVLSSILSMIIVLYSNRSDRSTYLPVTNKVVQY